MARLPYIILTLSVLLPLLFVPVSTLAQGARPSAEVDKYRSYYLEQKDAEPKDGAVKVTFLGTTTLLFDDGETQLMIDGFFTRPSLK